MEYEVPQFLKSREILTEKLAAAYKPKLYTLCDPEK